MSVKKSIYESAVIESNDRSRSANIKNGIIGFQYYEDIFSPIITGKMSIINTGNVITSAKKTDRYPQSLYNGLPVRGGERVSFKIAANSSTNPVFDFSDDPKNYFYVSSIENIIRKSNKEMFNISLIPRESITNETVRVVKKFPVDYPISQSVERILKENLVTERIGIIDATSNNYGFIGSNKKPFTTLIWLASKSTPVGSKGGGTAGFLFYQTKDGFQFRSIDNLIKQKPKAIYYYDESKTTYDINDNKVNNDFRILDFTINKNQDLLKNLMYGAYSSQILNFNPLTFEFNNIVYNQSKYTSSYLGNTNINFPSDDSGRSLGDRPSRILTQMMDVGTLDIASSTRVNADTTKYQSQALMRYNFLLIQNLSVTIPLNTNLRAGDLIICKFNKISKTPQPNYDDEISGLYMIKELCHHFGVTRSYTSLKLVRDTFGDVQNNDR